MEPGDLTETCLEYAAEEVGDITPKVIELLYQRQPEASQTFLRHVPGTTLKALQGSMVEETLYCFMTYPTNPLEIELILESTISNHIETLNIAAPLMQAMFQALHDAVLSSVPETAMPERKAWSELHSQLQDLIARSIATHELMAARVSIAG